MCRLPGSVLYLHGHPSPETRSVGHKFIGAISYADDLTLIAPTHEATQRMLIICEEFANEYDVLFNSTKSQVVVFNHKYRQRLSDLILCNTPVPYQTEATHLGLKIGPDAARANLTQAICVLNTQCNMILCNYSHCRFDTLRHLFKT
jgi:hypothetical protein